MNMSRLSFSLLLCLSAFSTRAQQLDLDEKKAATLDGIEFGYTIRNEQTKNVSSEEYSRFEITLYATNKSGCTRLYAEKPNDGDRQNLVASFSCINANGKRLTSKGGQVKAKDFMVQVKMNDKMVPVKAGYIFRNGESIRDNIIVLVPKDERPKIQCVVNYLPELQ